MELTINGAKMNVAAADDTPLLWALRDRLGMTGTKFGCGMALCGACTVHVDGVLTDWTIGGSYLPSGCGFLRYGCTSSGGAAPDFDGFGTGGIAMTDAKRPGLAYGRPVQWSVRDTDVP